MAVVLGGPFAQVGTGCLAGSDGRATSRGWHLEGFTPEWKEHDCFVFLFIYIYNQFYNHK